jgi:hypothetical protein
MPFELFYARFPEIARRETRHVEVLDDDNIWMLPAAEYDFHEMFCDEPNCDCRRVFLSVTSSRNSKTEAVIGYGWEPKSFYRRWFKQGSEEEISCLQGPELNLLSPQGKHADEILELFKDVLQKDRAYIERIKRHYRIFRATVDKPRHPLLRRRRTGG